MLPRGQRIPRKMFPQYNQPHRTWKGTSLRVFCYPSEAGVVNTQRFAVVVSKKKFQTHVARNLFKRRVLAVIHEQRQNFTKLNFALYVIYPERGVEDISFLEIKEDIIALLK